MPPIKCKQEITSGFYGRSQHRNILRVNKGFHLDQHFFIRSRNNNNFILLKISVKGLAGLRMRLVAEISICFLKNQLAGNNLPFLLARQSKNQRRRPGLRVKTRKENIGIEEQSDHRFKNLRARASVALSTLSSRKNSLTRSVLYSSIKASS